MNRRLDAAIAEALGYEVTLRPLGYWAMRKKRPWKPLPHYSSDSNDMLMLGREMRELGAKKADTMPKAVALAAYRALTGKEWKE